MAKIKIEPRDGSAPWGFPGEQKYRDKQSLSSGEVELAIYLAENKSWYAAFREILDDDLWDKRFVSSSKNDLIEQMLDPLDRPLMTMAKRAQEKGF